MKAISRWTDVIGAIPLMNKTGDQGARMGAMENKVIKNRSKGVRTRGERKDRIPTRHTMDVFLRRRSRR
jgi:hypothetical protein